MERIKLNVQTIDKESFMEFGHFIDIPTPKASIELNGVFKYYDKVAIFNSTAPTGIGILEVFNREPIMNILERHENTQELLIALDTDFQFIVARSADGDLNIRENAKAFLIKQGQAVIINPGVWHWIPFPCQKSGKLLVMIKEGTPDNDLIILDIEKVMNFLFEIII